VGEEDGVVGHKRYANLAKSLNKPIMLEVLSLGSKHPKELVMALLDKVMKSGILRSNICSKGYLLLLDGPKGGLEVGMVSRGWLGGRIRSGLTRIRG